MSEEREVDLTIVVPVKNEEKMIDVFLEATISILEDNNILFEIIFVDDGSTDETLSIIKNRSSKDVRVKYISLSRNFGKEAAMYAGICNASGDFVVTMDVDMQDPPSLLPEMFSILKRGEYDSVATRRIDRNGEPAIRSFFARRFYKIINRMSDVEIVDGARDYRMMNPKMVEAVKGLTEFNRFSKGLYSWVGFRTKWLEYENVKRAKGETNWKFWKLFKYALDGIINFSDVPVTLSSWVGLGMTAISVLALLIVIARQMIFGDPVAGWASTVCLIIFIGGIQLFCIGIMGQYLARTYMEVKKRPVYIVSETNLDSEEKEETDGKMSIR